MKKKKDVIGIILAGGIGSRLFPITNVTSKQLLPIYDKPLIYYPLYTLMQSGIRNIIVISSKEYLPVYKKLLDQNFNVNFKFIVQEKPEGIAQSFTITNQIIKNFHRIVLILGDNIFFSNKTHIEIKKSFLSEKAFLFSYKSKSPNQYGVLKRLKNKNKYKIIEKPNKFISNEIITGLYSYPNDVISLAKNLKKSKRNEYEISDINNFFIKERRVHISNLSRNDKWFDAGTFETLFDANKFVRDKFNKFKTIFDPIIF